MAKESNMERGREILLPLPETQNTGHTFRCRNRIPGRNLRREI
jgi:hypothetical protein